MNVNFVLGVVKLASLGILVITVQKTSMEVDGKSDGDFRA